MSCLDWSSPNPVENHIQALPNKNHETLGRKHQKNAYDAINYSDDGSWPFPLECSFFFETPLVSHEHSPSYSSDPLPEGFLYAPCTFLSRACCSFSSCLWTPWSLSPSCCCYSWLCLPCMHPVQHEQEAHLQWSLTVAYYPPPHVSICCNFFPFSRSSCASLLHVDSVHRASRGQGIFPC